MSTGMRLGIALALSLVMGAASAASNSAVGSWKTVDDKTGKEKARIEITESGGELQGRIVELYHPSKPDPLCEKCEGERHNQPITGMVMLWDMKKDGDAWSGGRILDPESGKVYTAKMSLSENGQVLNVRGFIGVSLLGRTQQWHRQP